ncbi:hypothetical protein C0J52_15420 [Blattella germanica]|nr:hypothetical protein C0J52_15420 [Blattella germanica]
MDTAGEQGEQNEQIAEEDEAKIRYRKLLSSAKESFENASRLLRRKIPCTGHLMTPRRLWIQTIPTQECDVVLMFPSGAQDFTLILLKAAEEVHLPKTLRKEYGGGLKEFVQQEVSYFEGTENEREFFTTQERQWLVLHLLQTLRAGPGDQVGGLKLIEGQAIDEICDYFGVKITMYFAWLGHYTTALIVPTVVGFVFWIGFCGRDQATEDVGFVLFSFFNVLWASVYVEAWKRYSAELAYRWGTLDQRDELLIEPRPLFTGTLEISPVTGQLEPTYPAWKRNVFRYLVSLPIIFMCLLVVFIIMIFTLQLQEWWDQRITERGYFFCLSYLPKIMLAVVITLLDEAYYKVAIWLNDKENYRLETKYENHLIVKVALFQFVNSFLSLFYIAFYLQDMEKLREQLAALLIARQVIGNLKESALPYILEQLRLAKLSFDLFGALSPTEAKKDLTSNATEDSGEANPTNKANRSISQAELESSLFKYDGTFADHLEMFIQLGYVVLFSSAFPMAAFCALINNLIEIRSDAFKLCFTFQRPFGQRVSSIGTWQNAMEVMCLIAVLVNCALIGLSGQHIMLTLRFIITCAIPDLPEWVATEMAKVEFARREACRRLSSQTTSPAPDAAIPPPGLVIGRFVVSPASETTTETDETQSDAPPFNNSPISEENLPTPIVENAAPPMEEPTPPTVRTSPIENKQLSPSIAKSLPKKSTRDWLGPEGETLGYHLTIGPHGVDWARRLGLDPARKGSEPEMGSASGGDLRRSTDCIAHKDLAASSDSDLLRSAPPWAVPHTRSKFRFSPEKEASSDSSRTVSSQEGDDNAAAGGGAAAVAAPPPATTPTSPPKQDDLAAAAAAAAAKKTRVKQSLMKRARSVAIFSLKLKERRAREASAKAEETKAKEKWVPPANVGGELSCIPIEKLISVDDVAIDLQRRMNPSGNL